MIEDVIGEIESVLKVAKFNYQSRGIKPTREHATLFNMYLIGYSNFPTLYKESVLRDFNSFFQESYYKRGVLK